MINPNICQCPVCKKYHFELLLRPRITRDLYGRAKFSGQFYSCECGAYTLSPETGLYNLKDEVARQYGVTKIQPGPPKVVKAVPPKIRRAS